MEIFEITVFNALCRHELQAITEKDPITLSCIHCLAVIVVIEV